MYLLFKNIIKKILVNILDRFEYIKEKSNLEKILKLDNVYISHSFSKGKYSNIFINGIVKELTVGEKVSTRRYCNFLLYNNSKLIINDNVFFNNYCSVNCLDYIEIGSNTLFGEGVKIYDHNHKYLYNPNLVISKHDFDTAQVIIGNNCWIGSNVTILKGVTIGDNVIIGANCLIYKSIPSNSIVKHKEDLIIETR